MSNAREIYKLCYRAWRKQATYEVQSLWANHRPIYQAAARSWVDRTRVIDCWSDSDRCLQFYHRKFKLAGW